MQESWQNKVPGSMEERHKRLVQIVYLLQLASLVSGFLTLFAAVVINYVRRNDLQGSWLESHFRWQVRTFWLTLVWMVIGWVLTIILIGWVVVTATTFWLLYRVVKGWLYLSENRTMPA